MNEDIYKTHRLLRNSNLPGIPNFIWTLMDEAKEKNDRVLEALEQQPLDIVEVQKALTSAKNAVANAMENTNVMIEDRKSTRLNSSHVAISYAVFCLKKKKKNK